MWPNFDGKPYSRAALAAHINGLDFSKWRRKDGSAGKPLFIVLHNTSVPTIKLWLSWSPEKRQQYILNVENMYEVEDHWHAGPHFFVPPDADICAFGFSDPTTCGTHASCFNSDSIGIEQVGEFNVEAYDTGPGALVRDNAVYLMALLHRKLGLQPDGFVYGKSGLHFHVDCRADNHDCPGSNVHRPDIIARVKAAMATLSNAAPLPADAPPASPPPEPSPTVPATPNSAPAGLLTKIVGLAVDSSVARYLWHQRGRAPAGYIKGMASTFGRVYVAFKAGDSSAQLMARANTGNDDVDAISWFNSNFRAVGMHNDVGGPETLRHVFVLLTGLGMRESSGQYGEGRDVTADNVTADTAEAGLFQQSWNSQGASREFSKIFGRYSLPETDGLLSIFKEGVTPRPSSLQNYGSGPGYDFQKLCKSKPAFAVECAAVGLRVIRRHWGPLNRKEAEIRPEADALYHQIQDIVDAG